MKNNKAAAFLGALLATGMFSSALAADAAPEPSATPAVATPPAAAPEPVDVEVFRGVKILPTRLGNIYPPGQVYDGREGWVALDMMIDAKGKPYEAMVIDSNGNRALEKAALNAVDKLQFEPASRGGTPIDSSFTFKFKFSLRDLARGASGDFVSRYKQFNKAIDAGDRAKADAELAHLEAKNLYEQGFENLGKYRYHVQWGTPAEQLEDVTRAIADERKPVYLPKDTFTTLLFAKFRLETLSGDYGRALDTWDDLEPLATPETRAAAQIALARIRALQVSNQAVSRPALIDEHSYWSGRLFRNRFSIAVASGSVNEIKIRCAQQYLFFKYQPGLQYSIGSKKDQHCGIQVVGEPGTKFDLIE